MSHHMLEEVESKGPPPSVNSGASSALTEEHNGLEGDLPLPDTSMRAWTYLLGVWIIEGMLWGRLPCPAFSSAKY